MEREAIFFAECPRCGDLGLESLLTYSYCIGCDYNSIEDIGPSMLLKSKPFSPIEINEFQSSKQKRRFFLGEEIADAA
jgi:hypothetical protein